MKNNWRRISGIVSITLICLIIDQLSKLIAVDRLIENKSVQVINNFFSLTLCYNTGGAWSIFSNNTFMLVIISIIALGFIIYTLVKNKSKLYTISASIFMGGLIGNLIDRVVRGKVTDFIDFIIFGYDFPVFNIADICIVVSAIIIVISLFREKEDGNENS